MSQQFTPSCGRARARRLSGYYFAVLAALLIAISAPCAHAQCKVIYTISSQWPSGFGAAISIQNTGTTAWTSWTLTWAFANGQTITQLWNGTETQSGANVTVKSMSYNGAIAAGATYSGMGFNGTWNNVTNAIPTSFAINGTTCNTSLTATTTTLAASSTTTTTGTSITLTATVSPSEATGTVTFYDGTTSLGTGTLSSGKATLSTSFSTTGTHSITAVYGGSSTYATSTSSAVSITVSSSKTATTTTLTASTTTPTVGASVTLTTKVSPTAATGTVTFYSGTTSLGTGTLSSGTATLTTSFSTAGTYSLTAVYGGSTTYATSTSSAVSITVSTSSKTATTTTLTVSTTTPSAGTSFTLTATVSPSAATGTVTFYQGTTSLGTGTLSSGTATLSTSISTAGTYSLTAVYGGSTTYATSTSSAVSITVTSGTGLATTFKGHFLDLYGDINTANGYFSPLGIPYHSVETLIVEAPDYGHETVSETYSYYLWLEALYGGVTGTWAPLQTAWSSYETYMIPSATDQPTNSGYNPSSPATYAPTWDSPSGYPSTLTSSVAVGKDPIAAELDSTYGTWNIYGAHWILDTDDWYGYGVRENGTGSPSFYNSYQRGPMESVWLTIPQPCWDNFKYGNTSSGYLSLFTSGPWTQQWKYTDAPDADARSIQAMYWAEQFASAQGGSSIVTSLLPSAAKLGDYLRYSFFDKYFKVQGCQSTSCAVEDGTKNSSAYLLSWYYAWGGALPANGSWAWRIGSSDVHFGYQNPIAAYALSTDTALIPKSPTAKADWTTGLERQIEFYRWLQSSQGAIAGGATNSWGGGSNANETAWGGQYAVPPTGTSTFYGMSYIAEPSYDNPPSNQWFGFQAWSMERVAEYYYVTGNAHAKIILDPWIAWVEANTTTSGTSYSIPSSMTWSGQPALNWNASTQNWTAGTVFNSGLTVTITATTQDVGVTGSLAKALLYYSAGTAKWATTQDMTSFTLAQTLLKDVWADYRDSIGVSSPETGTTYNQFTTPIYVPAGWTGTMPNGDPINSNSTFLSIRTQYENDPNYAEVAAYAAGTGPAPVFKFHRFWAQVDIASAYAVYYLLFPND